VVDPRGTPLPAAQLTLWIVSAAPIPGATRGEVGLERAAEVKAEEAVGRHVFDLGRTTSDDEGAFALEVPAPPADARLRISARVARSGTVGIARRELALPPADADGLALLPLGDLRVGFLPPLEFHVRAQDAPVEGAEVTIYREATPVGWSAPHPEPVQSVERSDAQGFAGHVTTARRIAFSVRKAGFAVDHGAALLTPRGTRIQVELEPEVPTRGVLRDPAGRPLSGVELEAYELGGGSQSGLRALSETFRWVRRSAVATTGIDGRFELSGLGRERNYLLRAEPPADASYRVLEERVQIRGQELKLSFQRGLVLRAQIAFPAGRERGAASVVLQRHTPSAEWEDLALSQLAPDAEPEVGFDRLAPGLYRVALHAAGFAPVVTDPLRLAGDEAPTQLLLSPSDPPRELRGRVVAKGGQPLAGAVVQWSDFGTLHAETDAEGRFRLQGLPTGELVLAVGGAGYQNRAVEVPAGVEELPDVELGSLR